MTGLLGIRLAPDQLIGGPVGRRILAFVFAVVTIAIGTPAVRADADQEALAPQAAMDFSGAWVGTLRIPEPGERWQPNALRVVFKQSGYALQGSLVVGQSKSPIANGRVEATQFGTSLSFQLKGPDFVMRFELRPDGEVLRGVARVDGSRRGAPVELRRASDSTKTSAADATATSAAPARTSQPESASAPVTTVASAAKTMAVASKPVGFGGIYGGNFTLAGNTLTMYAVLTQSGDDLTGTVGPDAARQKAIVNGKVEKTAKGATLRFEMDLEKEQVLMTFELSPVAGGLKGTVTAEHAKERVAGPVELKQLR